MGFAGQVARCVLLAAALILAQKDFVSIPRALRHVPMAAAMDRSAEMGIPAACVEMAAILVWLAAMAFPATAMESASPIQRLFGILLL